MRNSSNADDNESLEVIHVIAGDPSYYKGKNKHYSEDVLSVEKDLWAKQ